MRLDSFYVCVMVYGLFDNSRRARSPVNENCALELQARLQYVVSGNEKLSQPLIRVRGPLTVYYLFASEITICGHSVIGSKIRKRGHSVGGG